MIGGLSFSPVEDLIVDAESCGSFKVLVKDIRENYLNGVNNVIYSSEGI